MNLSDIVDIQLGYQLRGKCQSSKINAQGTYSLIQIKDIDHAGALCSDNFVKINPQGNVERYLVTKGDVLFLSRGPKNIATIVEEPLNKTIVSYYFYILRANPTRILPKYLAWFINQPSAQVYLECSAQGSLMKTIPKLAFMNLKIQLPSLATQEAIAELNELQKKEADTLERLAHSRRKLVDGLSLKAALSENKF